MLSLFQRNRVAEVAPHIRRICDLTIPNKPTPNCHRSEERYNRSLPVIVCPWRDGWPVTNELTVAMTKDLSEQGIGLIRDAPMTTEEVVIGFWLEVDDAAEPSYFRATTQSNQRLGGGYWLVGVALEEYMNRDHREQLKALDICAAYLRPSFDQEDLGREEGPTS
jgi:hypothetical protein